jgi:hypothetical protein
MVAFGKLGQYLTLFQNGQVGKEAQERMLPFVQRERTANCFQPFWKRRTRMCRAIGVAAMVAVLWIGTANFVQGFD